MIVYTNIIKILLVIIGLLINNIAFNQKVHRVNYASQADIKVFVVNYTSQADLIVYKAKYTSQINKKGIWFFTPNIFQADYKIFFVDYASRLSI